MIPTLEEVRRSICALPRGYVAVLLGSVEDVESRLQSGQQLVPPVLPHRPLLWVSGQPCLQLVHPYEGNRTIPTAVMLT